MKAARHALQLKDAHFIVLPAIMIISFGDGEQGSNELRLVKTPTSLDLGCLSETYAIYKDLTHSRIGASEGAERLGELLRNDRPPFWNIWARCFFGFSTAFLVCPMAFGGSLIDGLVAGFFGAVVSILSLSTARRSSVFSTVSEYVLLPLSLFSYFFIENPLAELLQLFLFHFQHKP